MYEKMKARVNWPVTILLFIGLITVAFPLYMTIVIAFKQPTEMTNSISGILSLPAHWSLSNFAQAMELTDFWRSLGNSLTGDDQHCSALYPPALPDGICRRKK